MAGCKVWDLIKVPFPYTNRPVQQHRPALVVATAGGAGAPELLWVLMVTSAANRGWLGDIAVSDLTVAGLPAPSVVRPVKIATIESRDAAPIGRLPESDRSLVKAALQECLGPALAA